MNGPEAICKAEALDPLRTVYRCEKCGIEWDWNRMTAAEACPIMKGVEVIPAFLKRTGRVPEILAEAAETFASRNAEYGANYKRMGALLLAIFPEGGIPPIKTAEDADRLQTFLSALNKLQRYAHAFHRGGHKDSARDLIVYAAMLEEFTK